MDFNKSFFLLILLILILPVQLFAVGTWRVIQSFNAPCDNTSGLAWDGQYLWNTSWSSNSIYKINPVDGKVIDEISTNGVDQEDATFFQGYLWVSDLDAIRGTNQCVIRKYDISSMQEVDHITIDFTGYSVNPFEPDNRKINGVTNDGQYLWVNYMGLHCAQIDPSNGQILHHWTRIPTSINDVLDGMEWAWGDLFIVTNEAVIYEFDPCSGAILDIFKAPAGTGWGPEGITFDGQNLWYADLSSKKIYKLELVSDYYTKRRLSPKPTVLCNSATKPSIVNKSEMSFNLGASPLSKNAPIQITWAPSFAKPLSLALFDIRGKCLISTTLNGENGHAIINIPTQSAPGIYVLKIQPLGKTAQTKMIVIQ